VTHLGHEQAILVDARAAVAGLGPGDSQVVPAARAVDVAGRVRAVEGAHAADLIGVRPQVQVLQKRAAHTTQNQSVYKNNSRRDLLRHRQGRMCDCKSSKSYEKFCLLEVQVANVGYRQGRVHITVDNISETCSRSHQLRQGTLCD
jgi:hypothetical protein